jgi:hypothetical protein
MLCARRPTRTGKLAETRPNLFKEKNELLPLLFAKRFHNAGKPAAIGRADFIEESLARGGKMNSDQAPVLRVRAPLNEPIFL